jgi:4-hydroxy-2-oxoheptanedioate aldolase
VTLSCIDADAADMLFVGPNDLANSMGFECTTHESIPEVQDAIARVLKAAHDNGKYAGMFCTDPQQVLRRQEQGFDFMNCGYDVADILAAHGSMLKVIRK